MAAAGLVATMVALEKEEPAESVTEQQTMVVTEAAPDYSGYYEQIIEMLGLDSETELENVEYIKVQMEGINTELTQIKEFNGTLAGFGLFLVIVTLCRYIYNFFKMFISWRKVKWKVQSLIFFSRKLPKSFR